MLKTILIILGVVIAGFFIFVILTLCKAAGEADRQFIRYEERREIPPIQPTEKKS